MKIERLGDAVRRKRMSLGLTQEALCEGICSTMTISRLENGTQMPSYNRLRALLDRLDMPADRFYCHLTDQELLVAELYSTIVDANVRMNMTTPEDRASFRQQGLDAIARLEAIMDADDTLSRQLILRSQVILGPPEGEYPPEAQLQMLLEAISMTSPWFRLDRIQNGLYTTDELKIINQIAQTYSEGQDRQTTLDIYRQLYAYIQGHFREISPLRSCLILVNYNYARELVLAGRYRQAIQVADEGRRLSLFHDSTQYLPGILSHMAEAYHLLGEDDASRSLYIQSFYTLMATEDFQNMAVIQEEAREYLGLELPF